MFVSFCAFARFAIKAFKTKSYNFNIKLFTFAIKSVVNLASAIVSSVYILKADDY